MFSSMYSVLIPYTGDRTAGGSITRCRNVRIYTVNEERPWAEAVAIKDGKFLLVGLNDEAAQVTGP